MATTDTKQPDLARAETLWKAADLLRGQIDAAEYKHVVLGLLFLKYISDSFDARREELKAELAADGIKGPQLESLLENRDEYTAERVFWVPVESRWQNLQNQATRPEIATLIDDAILAIERDNPNLKSKLPRDYARRGIAPEKMKGLIDLIADIDYAQVDAAARAVGENADMVLGVKVRMSENVIARHGLEPLKRAIKACELSGVPAKIMCHIGGVSDPALMSQILDLLRPGDVLTHCYSGAPNIAGMGTNIVQDGKLLPAALAAKKRGVVFDIGHGGGSFDYTIAEAAIAQGCLPDTISSDVHVFSGNTPGMPYLPWVMSKLIGLGFTLPEVVSMATAAPARVISRIPKHGTLQVGAPADLSILEIVDGPVSFVDTRNNTRQGKVYLRPAGTVVAGVAFGRPYQAPFSVR